MSKKLNDHRFTHLRFQDQIVAQEARDRVEKAEAFNAQLKADKAALKKGQ